MSISRAPQPQPELPVGWAERLQQLGNAWKAERHGPRRDTVLGDLWLLVNAGLLKYLRLQAGRYPGVATEDLRDIAAQKSLDLLRKLDREQWDPGSDTAAQVCTFLATLARNGLIDHVRVVVSKRSKSLDWNGDLAAVEEELSRNWTSDDADNSIDRHRFADALRECATHLAPRARRAWFLRVFYDMASKDIATHPDVAMNAATVDVALARCRDRIRECMQTKGFAAGDLAPGTFTTLWEAFGCDSEPRA